MQTFWFYYRWQRKFTCHARPIWPPVSNWKLFLFGVAAGRLPDLEMAWSAKPRISRAYFATQPLQVPLQHIPSVRSSWIQGRAHFHEVLFSNWACPSLWSRWTQQGSLQWYSLTAFTGMPDFRVSEKKVEWIIQN